MTWTLLDVSVAQNGTVHRLIATRQRPQRWLLTLVATVPPLVLGLTVHLGVGPEPLVDPVTELIESGVGRRKLAAGPDATKRRT